MPPPLCTINPAHITMLRGVGIVFLVALAMALLTGRAYFRRVYARNEEPAGYWSAVASYAMLGLLCLGGTWVCAALPAG